MSEQQFLYIAGNWIEAIGANVAAAGVSIEIQDSTIGKWTRIIGDGIQGIGNFMIAEANEDSLAALGNRIQGIASEGNAVLAYHELMDDNEEINNQLEIISDSLQALGSYITAVARSDDNPPKAFGNELQAIGAIVEAIGVTNKLKSEEELGDQLRNIGKWIQGVGTIIQALSVTPGVTIFQREK
ncbi:DUF6944 family repetitive protein [Evansella cellulosilytica]|uniref:Uncharacterized protein n=1 Tax=Evansella cellulosilytica (strain ATCC 21833 / DSM 2522 / FERM P-1141 / JCM 9156 / N-4) TaxID=649639 RepID=E6U1D0_EVAC2|nr:hypothetical protein [Evansella cellulosilytica]ADU29177.1 hypothetical protein Bcell_0901 [Evansella cellulosilytica DSM 2522]